MTGQKEETFRFPSTNIKAQLELKRYNNLKALQSIDAERKRLETKRRILILSDFRLDSGSPKETVLKLYPMEKRLVTQAAAMLKYESNGYLLDLWGDQLRDIQEIPSNK